MSNEINQRKLLLKFANPATGVVTSFDENANLRIQVKKTVLSLQNTAVIAVDNLRPDRRNFLVSGFNQWQARNMAQPFIPVEFFIGRARTTNAGYGPGDEMRRLYVGSVHTTSMTQPPDVSLQMTCMSSLIDQNAAGTGFITSLVPKATTFKDLFMLLGRMMTSVEPVYEATKNPPVSATKYSELLLKSYSLTGAVAFLATLFDDILIFIDDDKLYAIDKGSPIKGGVVDVNVDSGLIGFPVVTQWGVEFKTMADVPVRLGGAVRLASRFNPGVNGEYIVTQVNYEVTSRDVPFYATWHASPAAPTGG